MITIVNRIYNSKNTYIEQGVGYHIGMITVNGYCVGGMGGRREMGEIWKDFCPNFPQPFLENIDRGSCNGGNRELILVFHNPH